LINFLISFLFFFIPFSFRRWWLMWLSLFIADWWSGLWIRWWSSSTRTFLSLILSPWTSTVSLFLMSSSPWSRWWIRWIRTRTWIRSSISMMSNYIRKYLDRESEYLFLLGDERFGQSLALSLICKIPMTTFTTMKTFIIFLWSISSTFTIVNHIYF